MKQLFDKIVKIELFTSNPPGPAPSDVIECPPTGIKPNIGISAQWVASNVLKSINVRIVNFYPSLPMSSYKWIRITAGYSQGDTATFEGMVFVAHQESPSPDGITLFTFEVGFTIGYLNADIKINQNPGVMRSAIYTDILGQLQTIYPGVPWSLSNTAPDQETEGYNNQGKLSDVLQDLKARWKIMYTLEGTNIVIFDAKQGREEIVDINYFSSPPIADAAGITFTAPWIPKLAPGMKIRIDPKYFRQTFAGRQVTYNPNDLMKVQTIDIQFNTVTNQNTMTVLALNTVEIVQASAS